MNGLRLIRGLFKKSREKIRRREGLIGVQDEIIIFRYSAIRNRGKSGNDNGLL